jgi:elongation factor G
MFHLQVPIGLEEFHEGVVDIVRRKSFKFGGAKGLDIQEGPVPADMADEVEARRAELVERVSEVRQYTLQYSTVRQYSAVQYSTV